MEGGSGKGISRGGLGVAIDLICSEYGLSPKEVVSLDIDRFRRSLELISDRKKKTLAVSARMFQAAIASILSGDAGASAFEDLMSELTDSEPKVLSDAELSDLGIGKK